jgi:cell division transport system permease protein
LEKVAAALKKMGVFDDILVPTDFANKIMRIVNVSRTVVMSIMVLFLFITFVMIFLTISSAILSHHDEIVLYRLLGGSYVFIYFPFVLLGVLYGIAGAVIGTLGAAFAIKALTPGIQALGKAIIGIGNISVGNMLPVYMVSIAVGLILALIAAMFSIRRFLVEMEVKGL